MSQKRKLAAENFTAKHEEIFPEDEIEDGKSEVSKKDARSEAGAGGKGTEKPKVEMKGKGKGRAKATVIEVAVAIPSGATTADIAATQLEPSSH